MPVDVYRLPGEKEFIPEDTHTMWRFVAALRKRGEADLDCPKVTTERAAVSPHVMRVTGCGRHGLYLRSTRSVPMEAAVAHLDPSLVTFHVVELVDLARAEPDPMVHGVYTLDLLTTNIQAAADLGCPRGEVVPATERRRPRSWNAYAVGCGRLARYEPNTYTWRVSRLETIVSAPAAEWLPLEEPEAYSSKDAIVVSVESDDPWQTVLAERKGGAWRRVCGAPCGAAVDRGGIFRVESSLGEYASATPSSPFTLPRDGRKSVTVTTRVPRDHAVTGTILLSGGAPLVLVGALVLATESDSTRSPAERVGGYGSIGVGVALALVGLWLSLTPSMPVSVK